MNGTWLQSDDPNAFNFINNQSAIVPRAMEATDLPVQGHGNASSSAATMYGATRSSVSSSTTSANGQGAGSYTSSVAMATASVGAGMKRNNGGGGNSTAGSTWTWQARQFSITVLQFNL